MTEGMRLHKIGASEIDGHEARHIAAAGHRHIQPGAHQRPSAVATHQIAAAHLFDLAGLQALNLRSYTLCILLKITQGPTEAAVHTFKRLHIFLESTFDMLLADN